ncbi:IclR family transcriptional regulator [Halomarina ordinaria]|uniref:IclR family transcriptional regulator n=1 Tax=Halomarina ordinaria TaxID=3033939 RepID=A0ABD5UC88_9EURY|nr:IclR family transcriptional regulator [Halomarina sp. PSRA2]
MENDSVTHGMGGSTNGVKAVETSFRIVDALKDTGGGKVTDIVDRTGLSKGAVYKHLTTLMDHDLVVKRGQEYTLGFRFLDYGGYLRSRYIGSELIKPQIQDLAEETGEVALFSIPEKDRVITLFRENGNKGVFTRTRLGMRLHMHQTAGGKAILSQFSRSEVEGVIERVGLPRATEATITDEEALFEELETIRERGFALNREESTEGLVAVSVPLTPDDTVIGACGIAGPRHRMGEERVMEEIPDLLLSVVNELELNITHSHGPIQLFCPE